MTHYFMLRLSDLRLGILSVQVVDISGKFITAFVVDDVERPNHIYYCINIILWFIVY